MTFSALGSDFSKLPAPVIGKFSFLFAALLALAILLALVLKKTECGAAFTFATNQE
jgi:hypothetical protein